MHVRGYRAVAGHRNGGLVLIAGIALLPLLASCSWLGRASNACRDPQIPADPENRPALQAAAGLEAPDTRNAVKIPALNEPEPARGAEEPCLSRPPSFGNT
jgi:uncharacterized lipoprotein